ncbi:hypothetical protein X740_05640 [Mesorhizobium sp. LNHC221B00]|nr:hypothetical protein X740_05640 [Mesorhizobium sp. LNHC221B00]
MICGVILAFPNYKAGIKDEAELVVLSRQPLGR